jgi:hypothetical protein
VLNAEEKLRSEIYATLMELTFASTEEKPAIVECLTQACFKLHELIIPSHITN